MNALVLGAVGLMGITYVGMISILFWANSKPPKPREALFKVAGTVKSTTPRFGRQGRMYAIEISIRTTQGGSWSGQIVLPPDQKATHANLPPRVSRLLELTGEAVELLSDDGTVAELIADLTTLIPIPCEGRRQRTPRGLCIEPTRE